MLPDLAKLKTRDVLISGGEPLLNPEWREIADLLKSNGLNLWLLTSGLSLAKHASDVAARFQSVTVSLDGACAKTYSDIRGVDAFDKVCEGIRSVAGAGVPTSVRVTLQKRNFLELPEFVTLARTLGANQVSFLAVDISNPRAFSRRDDFRSDLSLETEDIAMLDTLLKQIESDFAEDFLSKFIAESPSKLRHIRDYFAAIRGLSELPPVRCNAPEFSAVIGADGNVSPCFFIAGPVTNARSADLSTALNTDSMRSLRREIQSGERAECKKCVCFMWRDPASFSDEESRLVAISNG
jgi:radical SAM protein with 4Fe4S-binding SPASM domain